MKVHWHSTLLNVFYYTFYTPDPEEPSIVQGDRLCRGYAIDWGSDGRGDRVWFFGRRAIACYDNVVPVISFFTMSDREAKTLELPNVWQAIQPDEIYQSSEGRLVSFSSDQIKLGILYDAIGKHLRAINKGLVPLNGSTGLVLSEKPGYDFKSKILGKGGDRRFHSKIVEGILHFPGKQTTH